MTKQITNSIPIGVYNDYKYLSTKLFQQVISGVDSILGSNYHKFYDIPISSDIMKFRYHPDHYYKNLKPIFEKIFEKTENYSTIFHKCKKFCLSDKYLFDEIISVPITDKVVINQIVKSNSTGLARYIKLKSAKSKIGSDKNLLQQHRPICGSDFSELNPLFQHLLRISVNPDSLDVIRHERQDLIDSLPWDVRNRVKDKDIKSIRYCLPTDIYKQFLKISYKEYNIHKWLNLNENTLNFSQDENLYRIYTLLTNTPKDIRNNMLIYPVPVVELDVNASHFGELTSYIRKSEQHKDVLLNEISLLDDIHQNTDIYEYLRYDDTQTRDETKKHIFKYLLYSKEGSLKRRNIAKKFKSLFPNIWQFLLDDKITNGHQHLPCELMKNEALKINQVQIEMSKICFTAGIYDSIIIDERYLEILENKLKEVYKNNDCMLKYKIKKIGREINYARIYK